MWLTPCCHCINSLCTCILDNECGSIYILRRTEEVQGRLTMMVRSVEMLYEKERSYSLSCLRDD